jgi:hypothetical protein
METVCRLEVQLRRSEAFCAVTASFKTPVSCRLVLGMEAAKEREVRAKTEVKRVESMIPAERVIRNQTIVDDDEWRKNEGVEKQQAGEEERKRGRRPTQSARDIMDKRPDVLLWHCG